VRLRTSRSGGVVATADWDAFGNLRAQSGVGGDFGWTGEQRDAETGLTYLRARDYAPGVGVVPDARHGEPERRLGAGVHRVCLWE
jgi:uncharacterized protein RhaS with RHS repeats